VLFDHVNHANVYFLKKRFLLIPFFSVSSNSHVSGDWGGQSAPPYTTGDEVKTAKSLKEQRDKFDVPLTLALGDNFYDNGVKNAQDKRFQETFENVFDASLDNFQVLAGNHDYNGNVSAEVEYSSMSKRWNFPSLYYTWTEDLDNGAHIQV